jgi:hypothetical protein
METISFFEKKITLTPRDLNKVTATSLDDILLKKLKSMFENKCSEHGFVLPGTMEFVSRSMGYYENGRFDGCTVYYVKAKGTVLYPTDNIKVVAEVARKNKMGIYATYRDGAIRIQIPRDLHLGNDEFEEVEVGDKVLIEIKRSKFQINDSFILASGVFIKKATGEDIAPVGEEKVLGGNNEEDEEENDYEDEENEGIDDDEDDENESEEEEED